MSWTLGEEFQTPDGAARWTVFGTGDPIVLVHGTPYSSFLWRDIAPALALTRKVFVFDHLGFGVSDKHEGQDLSLAAQAKNFTRLLGYWGLSSPSVVAHDIGGAVALRALLLEDANYQDLTLFDAVSGGEWERGLFRLILTHADVFNQLPHYAHEALVASHLQHATHVGFRPDVLEAFLAPWRGADGQAAFYRQYSQIKQQDTLEYEHLLSELSLPIRLIWGREDRILPPEYAEWLHDRVPHAELSWVEGAGHVLQEDAPARLLAHSPQTSRAETEAKAGLLRRRQPCTPRSVINAAPAAIPAADELRLSAACAQGFRTIDRTTRGMRVCSGREWLTAREY